MMEMTQKQSRGVRYDVEYTEMTYTQSEHRDRQQDRLPRLDDIGKGKLSYRSLVRAHVDYIRDKIRDLNDNINQQKYN